MFDALVLTQDDAGKTHSSVMQLLEHDLPDEEVLVKIEYSGVNYKDALAVTGAGKIILDFPAIPGIDFAGTVEKSADPRFNTGDKVLLTGWGVGEQHWGGLAQYASVKADWLVPLPKALSAKDAMVIGTAGFTAQLCVNALIEGGVTSEQGTVLVTGASGGVGSVAVSLLKAQGFRVCAVTGRESQRDYLLSLGADDICMREQLLEPAKPLEKQLWAGAIDTVGGDVLAKVLSQTCAQGVVAACGLAGGFKLNTTVMPFILRNVRLQGVDSVYYPAQKRAAVWEQLAQAVKQLPVEVVHTLTLDAVPAYCADMLANKTHGRAIVAMAQ